MILRFGEVVLIRMQFHQTTGAKVRPAVALLDTGDEDFVAAPITSQSRHSEYDLAIEDWRSAGLNVASFVRVHKLTVLAKADILRSLALVSRRDSDALLALLCRSFCPKAPGT
jgi:mRNA-degrading endonuclease toxin of MazEF toxin-antitoxin module